MAQKRRPPLTREARDNHMIALAETLAEKQLEEGTASAQVITHYLKLAETREKRALENENLKEHNKLIKAKTKAIEHIERTDEIYKDAIAAMGLYGKSLNNQSKDDDMDETPNVL